MFKYASEMALLWRDRSIVMDRFRDYSAKSITAWQQSEDVFLTALYTIDKQRILENKIACRPCKEEVWDVNPILGRHNKLTLIAQKQPVGKHLITLGIRWISLNVGLKLGCTVPPPAVERVMKRFTN